VLNKWHDGFAETTKGTVKEVFKDAIRQVDGASERLNDAAKVFNIKIFLWLWFVSFIGGGTGGALVYKFFS